MVVYPLITGTELPSYSIHQRKGVFSSITNPTCTLQVGLPSLTRLVMFRTHPLQCDSLVSTSFFRQKQVDDATEGPRDG